MDMRLRYVSDPSIRRLVDTLVSSIEQLQLTPTEMREVAVLACVIHEEQNPSFGCRIKTQPGSRINGVEDAKPMGGDLADAFGDLVDVILVRYSLRQEVTTGMNDVLSVNKRIKERKLIVSNEVMKLIRRLH